MTPINTAGPFVFDGSGAGFVGRGRGRAGEVRGGDDVDGGELARRATRSSGESAGGGGVEMGAGSAA